ADVLIVLGAAVWSGGRASPTLQKRVAHGVDLLKAGAAPWVMVTGGLGRHPPTEAEVMRRLATEAGADSSRIILEDRATTTLESAEFCTAIMRKHGWTSAIIVTDGYHLPRSLMAFRALGAEVTGSASGGGSPTALGRTRWALTILREGAAYCWYAARLAGRVRAI